MAATNAAKARKAAQEQAGELIPVVPATPPADDWGTCPDCRQERRTERGRLVSHRAWSTWQLRMLPCQGTGKRPQPATP